MSPAGRRAVHRRGRLRSAARHASGEPPRLMRLRSQPPALIQNPALLSNSPLAIGNWLFAILASCLVCLVAAQTHASSPSSAAPLSPVALVATPDGARLFIACATANQ